jgi:hypothetical protein
MLSRSVSRFVSPLPENWKRHKDPQGADFFHNEVTQVSTYERPKPLPDGWKERRDPQTNVVCAPPRNRCRARRQRASSPVSYPCRADYYNWYSRETRMTLQGLEGAPLLPPVPPPSTPPPTVPPPAGPPPPIEPPPMGTPRSTPLSPSGRLKGLKDKLSTSFKKLGKPFSQKELPPPDCCPETGPLPDAPPEHEPSLGDRSHGRQSAGDL